LQKEGGVLSKKGFLFPKEEGFFPKKGSFPHFVCIVVHKL